MKFSTAWAKIAAQNVTLKVATVTLAGIALVQMMILLQLALRNPLVVERGCFSKITDAKPSGVTSEEIKSFLSEALPMRFDSTVVLKEGFLSIEESAFREKEQATLKQRQMSQRIIISDVKVDGQNISVFTDRLIGVGKIKSVLPLNVKVTVQQTTRTESNPYGLILSNVSQVDEKGGGQ